MATSNNLVTKFFESLGSSGKQVATIDYDKDQTWTKCELANYAVSLAERLKKSHSAKQVFLTFTYQSAFLPALYLGCWLSKSAILPGNLKWTPEDLEKILQRFEKAGIPIQLIVDSAVLSEIPWLQNIQNVIFISSEKVEKNDKIINQDIEPASLAVFLITSGTTAEPRILGFDHQTLFKAAKAEVDFEDYSSTDRICNLRPHYTSAGLNTLWSFYFCGFQLIFSNRVSQVPLWRFFSNLVVKSACSHLIASPTYLSALYNSPEASLRFNKVKLYFGGNSLHPEIINRLIEVGFLPAMRYGMTEFARIVSKKNYSTISKYFDKEDVGQPAKDLQFEISDGKLSISGPGLFSHEILDSKLKAFDFNRWYNTFDQVKSIDKGAIQLVGRIPGFVTINGFTFNTLEVESVLRSNDKVLDCIVVKIQKTNKLYAFVVTSTKNLRSDLQVECKLRLPDYKRPEIIEINKWPQSANGKIDLVRLEKIVQTDHSIN